MKMLRKLINKILGSDAPCGHMAMDDEGTLTGDLHTPANGVCAECCNET